MGFYALTAVLLAYCIAVSSKSSDRNAAVSRPGTALLRTVSVETGNAAVGDTLGLGLTSQAVPAVFQRKRSSHPVCLLPHRLGPLPHCVRPLRRAAQDNCCPPSI